MTARKANPQRTGRPPKYKPEFVRQAYELALLGHTDEELARVFDVEVRTIHAWKHDYPEFSHALNEGKDEADAKVARSLYQRAMGYEHKAVKIVADARTGMDHTVEYIERYPPDTTAAIFWLKNRQRAKWRDQQDVKHSGTVGLVQAMKELDGLV